MKSKNKKNQSGQSLVEYLIIVALVAVGGIGVMQVVGQSVNASFARVAKSLGAKVEGRIDYAQVKQSQISKKNFRNFMSGTGSTKNGNNGGDSEE